MYKQNIFDKRKKLSDALIFKREDVFYPSYFPDEITSREKETTEITYALNPILENKRARNLLVYGSPGTGKTLISNYVLKQLIEYTSKVKYLYINVIEDNSRFAIYSKLLNQQFSTPLPRRGLGIDELLNRLKEDLQKSQFHPILILDEIDKLPKDELSLLLYDLSRFEINNKYFTLILITNHKEFLISLDSRTLSSLFLTELEFKKYTPQELKEILKERIEYGLVKGAISEDLIGYITGYAAKNGGDARIAIDLLYKSAKETEKKGEPTITKEIIISSSKLIDSVKLLEKLSYLDSKHKKLLEAIPKEGIESGDLYKLFEKETHRSIRRYLEILEKIDLVSITQANTKRGKSRKIELTFNKELLK